MASLFQLRDRPADRRVDTAAEGPRGFGLALDGPYPLEQILLRTGAIVGYARRTEGKGLHGRRVERFGPIGNPRENSRRALRRKQQSLWPLSGAGIGSFSGGQDPRRYLQDVAAFHRGLHQNVFDECRYLAAFFRERGQG